MTTRYSIRKAIHNPAYLLWVLREHSIKSAKQLFAYFATGDKYLTDSLRHLADADLITWKTGGWGSIDQIKLNKSCFKLLSTLGASLTELASRSDNTIFVEPFFPRPHFSQDSPDVFVLMPFSQELKPVYDDHIKKVCAGFELSVARADDFFTTHEAMTDLWSAVYRSRIVIADCTGRNPNVFYELGIAHTIGRPVVLLTQSEADVPFDIRHIRYIKYDFTPCGMAQLEDSLAATLISVIESEEPRLIGGRHE